VLISGATVTVVVPAGVDGAAPPVAVPALLLWLVPADSAAVDKVAVKTLDETVGAATGATAVPERTAEAAAPDALVPDVPAVVLG
jgi:hypothetical protein